MPSDSRTAPAGVTVTRHTIFAGVAQGLLARGVAPPKGRGLQLCRGLQTEQIAVRRVLLGV